MSHLMSPEVILERAVARPYIGGGVVRCLDRAGWHLIHARHETWADDSSYLAEGRIDQFKVIVWGVEDGQLERTYRTTTQVLNHAIHPEGLLQSQHRRAWQELALPLGQKLGVIE